MGHAPERVTERGVWRALQGIRVAAVSREQALALMCDAIVSGAGAIFAFCNAHSVNLARHDAAFGGALGTATVFNDGVGMDIAMRLLGQAPFPDNLNGTDLTPALLGVLPPGTPVYLLGSPEGVAHEAMAVLSTRFPHVQFVGADHGWFDPDAEPAVAARIRATGARLVIVGMGQPRQELWAARHVDALGAVLLCAGAYLDFAAGRFPRAPGWVRAARLEWIYRLLQEPRRLARRYLIGNLTFLVAVMTERIVGRSR